MNSLLDCCFPKQEQDLQITDKEKKDFAPYSSDSDSNLKYSFKPNPNIINDNKYNLQFFKNLDHNIESEKREENKNTKENEKEEIICTSHINNNNINLNVKKQEEPLNETNSNREKMNNSSRLNYTEQSTEIFLNRTITQDDIDNGPTIIIKETEGNQLNNGAIEINACGCEIGSRKAKDGVTLFGPILTDEKNNIINDILIAPNFKDINSHLFVIYYREKKYYIRTYKDQFSNGLSVLLVRIKKVYPRKKSEMFMIGDLFFVFKVQIDKTIKKISITKLSCKRSPDEEKKTFDSESVLKEGNKITIGRDKKCTMSYSSDKSFSKIHSTIYYNKSKEMWEIQDGTDEKTSTNGVWVIPKHSMEIFDNMNFKIMGCSKFVINLYNK